MKKKLLIIVVIFTILLIGCQKKECWHCLMIDHYGMGNIDSTYVDVCDKTQAEISQWEIDRSKEMIKVGGIDSIPTAIHRTAKCK